MKLDIKLFADGADIGNMYELYVCGKVSGFTTNPSLMRKAGVKDYKLYANKVLELIPDMPISFEVFSDDLEIMEREAKEISSWGDNVYVKIPITNTFGESTAPIIKNLSDDSIKLNITAILTLEQVDVAIDNLSINTPSIISVFAGRIADTGINPKYIMVMSSIKISHNKNCELLWASTREFYNIIQAINSGCDIITVTPDILKKLPMYGKDLTELSLETVKMFYEDAVAAGYKIL
jgi:transaldolase